MLDLERRLTDVERGADNKSRNMEHDLRTEQERASQLQRSVSEQEKKIRDLQDQIERLRGQERSPLKLEPYVDTRKAQKEKRMAALKEVYNAFDLDGEGDVGADEMLALGQARRRLGQKDGEWTQEMNKNLLQKMKADRKGNVTVENFCKYFSDMLPTDEKEFERNISQFLQCAKTMQETKSSSPQLSPQNASPKIKDLSTDLRDATRQATQVAKEKQLSKEERIALAAERRAKQNWPGFK